MKKKYIFSIVLFVSGLISLFTYSIIGSEILPDGSLKEPFGLIPVGVFFISMGLILALLASLYSLFHNPNKFDKWIFGITLTLIILTGLYLTASFAYLNELANQETSINAKS